MPPFSPFFPTDNVVEMCPLCRVSCWFHTHCVSERLLQGVDS